MRSALRAVVGKLHLSPFRFFLLFALTGIGLLLLLAADWWICLPAGKAAYYVGRRQCARCHQEETELWAGSDHALAMAPATPETVLGDFGDRQFTHQGLSSRLFRRGEEFYVTTDGPTGKLETFQVKYTFGVRPLQQYLVEFPGGRMQCLGIAWDTEKKRWFHLYPDEKVPHDDLLHWTRPLQNWNYMCAECHSTNLQKNFDLKTKTYHTTFSEIEVSCETCHGPGSLHVELADSKGLFWDRRIGYGLPRLKDQDPRVEIETCAPCHARRRVVYPNLRQGKPLPPGPGQKFLDYYVPELLEGNLYYADGQILEEDYVYGSFIQSRMYREKVRCSDCHQPHSGRVKFNDNRLCGQCHVPTTYDTPKHHHHPDASKPGTLCVECHMPETKYMVVDPRRDHSIRVPRPDLTVDLKIPNACNGCHHDESKGETPQWARQQVQKWYRTPVKPRHFAYAIAAGRQQEPQGERMLEAVVRRRDVSPMVRASAILLLAGYGPQSAASAARAGLKDPEALVRLAAARSLQGLPANELTVPLAPLLHDPLRAVRTEAARLLAGASLHNLATEDRRVLDAALAEYVIGQESLGDRAEAHLNLAVVFGKLGKLDRAEQEYRTAIGLDPEFVPVRLNLGMLYGRRGKTAEAVAEFREAVGLQRKLLAQAAEYSLDASHPRLLLAEIHYSLGLLLAEEKADLPEAAEHLAEAVRLSPKNARMHYNYGLALQHLGRPEEAENLFRTAYELAPGDVDYLHALAILYTQQQRWPRALKCARELARRHPRNPRMKALLEHVQRQAAAADKPD